MNPNKQSFENICDDVRKSYKNALPDFQENDIPVFLEYEYIPPERRKKTGLYSPDEYERDIEWDFVKYDEVYLLNEDRKKIMEKAKTRFLEEYSPRIFKWLPIIPRSLLTCEEALRKGYQKEIQEIIKDLNRTEKRKRWFDIDK
jgi:hypothetical protein